MHGVHRVRLLAGTAAALIAALSVHAQASQQSAPARPDRDRVSLPLAVIRAALSYRGVPYVTGGDSRSGLDCSGLVYRAFLDAAGMDLPRGVEGLFEAGTGVGPGPSGPESYPVLHLGDLLFFDTESAGAPRRVSHVGIYAGSGRFIHAASEGARTGVIVSEIDSPYYRERFLGARRVIPWRAPALDVLVTDADEQLSTADPFPSRERMSIRVFNGMSGGGPLDVEVLRNGEKVLAKRIAPNAFRPAEIPLVPEAGTWTVKISRIFHGRELQSMTFPVEE